MAKKKPTIIEKKIVMRSVNLDNEILEYLKWKDSKNSEKNISASIRGIIRKEMDFDRDFARYLSAQGIQYIYK